MYKEISFWVGLFMTMFFVEAVIKLILYKLICFFAKKNKGAYIGDYYFSLEEFAFDLTLFIFGLLLIFH